MVEVALLHSALAIRLSNRNWTNKKCWKNKWTMGMFRHIGSSQQSVLRKKTSRTSCLNKCQRVPSLESFIVLVARCVYAHANSNNKLVCELRISGSHSFVRMQWINKSNFAFCFQGTERKKTWKSKKQRIIPVVAKTGDTTEKMHEVPEPIKRFKVQHIVERTACALRTKENRRSMEINIWMK